MSFISALYSYLIVAVTTAFVSGIVFSSVFKETYVSAVLPMLLATALLIVLSLRKNDRLSLYLTLLFFFLAGMYCSNTAGKHPQATDHIYNKLVDDEVVVTGIVKRIFSFTGEVTRFDVATRSMRTGQSPFLPVSGTIRYTIKERLSSSLYPGTTVIVRARLKYPHKFATPGSFDYPAYLANKNIYVTGYIESPLYITPVARDSPLSEQLRYFPELLREKINRFIDHSLDQEQASVYKALLTGDRTAVSPEIIDLFKNSGTLHILAISGIHMSLLGVFLYTLIFWLLRRSTWLIVRINTKKTAAFLSIIPLLFYTLIAGANTPVLRSFLMSLIAILAICSGRIHSFATLVSCAALLILIFSPGQLFSPSFQLTFAAVIAITTAIPAIEAVSRKVSAGISNKFLSTTSLWAAAGIGVSLAATAGTAPLLIYHFNRISLVGVAANLIVEPLLCLWTLIFGFIAVCCIVIVPPVADLLLHIGSYGILLAISVVRLIGSQPHASVFLPAMMPLHILVYYLSLLVFLFWNKLPLRLRPFLLILPITVLLFIIVPPAELRKQFINESKITFLDVGHGSCTFIEMAGGRRILIDGGAISSPNFDIGERVIAPFLFRRGINTVDDIIITHPDSDHYNGIGVLLKRFKVQSLWLSTLHQDSSGWHELQEIAKNRNITIHVPQSAGLVYQSGDAQLQVVANTSSHGQAASNDNGLLLKFRHGSFSALFPGDISAAVERKLIDQEIDLRATLLLAPHHGSATSNSNTFLASVSPQWMIISTGNHSGFSLPAQSVLERCKKYNITTLLIHQTGTVTVTIKKGEYRIETLLGRWSGIEEKAVFAAIRR